MIACIYEGGAEKAVLDLLMENECLYFSKADLLSGDFHSAGIREGVCIEVPWLFDQRGLD